MATDPRLQHSSVLDQHYTDQSTLTGGDLSHSETLPSISFDDDTEKQPGFLKDLNDRILILREENFDLKMKLYLLETQENLSGDSESKRKILREFDRKNEEIRNLKSHCNRLCTEIVELKKMLAEKNSKTTTTRTSAKKTTKKTKENVLQQQKSNEPNDDDDVGDGYPSTLTSSSLSNINERLLSLAGQLDTINMKIMKHNNNDDVVDNIIID